MRYRLDVNTLEPRPPPSELGLNDIGRVRLRTSAPLCADPYSRNRTTGCFILVDEATNDTVGRRHGGKSHGLMGMDPAVVAFGFGVGLLVA